jgi:hypothetical protein
LANKSVAPTYFGLNPELLSELGPIKTFRNPYHFGTSVTAMLGYGDPSVVLEDPDA